MKPVHVTFDEDLLAAFDAAGEVRAKGRSAVLRQLTREFLVRRRAAEIDAEYARAYGDIDDPLGEEFAGWEIEGASGKA